MPAKAKADLRLVGPDLSELERVVTEAAAETMPVVTIESAVRERFINEMRKLESERDSLVEKRDLFRRQMEAVLTGLDAQIADHDAAISLYRGGLAPEVQPEKGTAA